MKLAIAVPKNNTIIVSAANPPNIIPMMSSGQVRSILRLSLAYLREAMEMFGLPGSRKIEVRRPDLVSIRTSDLLPSLIDIYLAMASGQLENPGS